MVLVEPLEEVRAPGAAGLEERDAEVREPVEHAATDDVAAANMMSNGNSSVCSVG